MMVMVLYYVFSLKDTVEIVRYQSMSLFQMKKDKSNLISFSEVSYFQSFVHFFYLKFSMQNRLTKFHAV